MSYKFEDICKFQEGETYYECQSWIGNLMFTLKNDPIIEGDKVRFIGITEDGKEIEYLMTKGFEHYGPRIYDSPQYITIEEIRKIAGETK